MSWSTTAPRSRPDRRRRVRARAGRGAGRHRRRQSVRLALFSSSWKDRPAPVWPPTCRGARVIDRRVPVRVLNWCVAPRRDGRRSSGSAGRFDVVHAAHPLLIPVARAPRGRDRSTTSTSSTTPSAPSRDPARLSRAGARARASARTASSSPRAIRRTGSSRPCRFRRARSWSPARPARLDRRRPAYAAQSRGLHPVPRHARAPQERRHACSTPTRSCWRTARPPAARVWPDAHRRRRQPGSRRMAEPPLAGTRATTSATSPTRSGARCTSGRSLLVLPSFDEGSACRLLEAMALGVPVVASDRGRAARGAGDAGLLVRPDRADALAAAIQRVLDDRCWRTRACARPGPRRDTLLARRRRGRSGSSMRDAVRRRESATCASRIDARELVRPANRRRPVPVAHCSLHWWTRCRRARAHGSRSRPLDGPVQRAGTARAVQTMSSRRAAARAGNRARWPRRCDEPDRCAVRARLHGAARCARAPSCWRSTTSRSSPIRSGSVARRAAAAAVTRLGRAARTRRAHRLGVLAREIVRHLGVAPQRIRVIPPRARRQPGRAGPPAAEPHRGTARAVRRVDLQPAARRPPALRAMPAVRGACRTRASTSSATTARWPRIDLARSADGSGVGARARRVDYVDDADLRGALRKASVFVFLSEYEGFGLTPLEALARRAARGARHAGRARGVRPGGALCRRARCAGRRRRARDHARRLTQRDSRAAGGGASRAGAVPLGADAAAARWRDRGGAVTGDADHRHRVVTTRGSDLERCLASLAAAPPGCSHDIVVVDNASTDGAPSGAGAAFRTCADRAGGQRRLRARQQPRHPRDAQRTRAAAQHRHGRAAGAIDALVAALRGTARRGRRRARGWSTARARRSCRSGRCSARGAKRARSCLVPRHARRTWPRRRRCEADDSPRTVRGWVSGACLLVRRAEPRRSGLLDERYFMYTEDVDFCAALRAAGRTGPLHAARSCHLRGRSAHGARRPTSRRYRRSQLAFYQKHHPRWAPLLAWYLRRRVAASRHLDRGPAGCD